MKKLLFFKSSSSAGKHEPEKQVQGKNPPEKRGNDKIHEKIWSSKTVVYEGQNPTQPNEASPFGPRLARSLSFSSASINRKDIDWRNWSSSNDESKSPKSGCSGIPKHKPRHPPGFRSVTPERPLMESMSEPDSTRNLRQERKADNSSLSSSDISTRALDVYIDGEELHERCQNSYKSSKPPKSHLNEHLTNRNRSMSFSEVGVRLQHPSKDHSERESEHQSKHDIAKHVMERLSKCHVFTEQEFNLDVPVTVDDICTNECADIDLPIKDQTNLLAHFCDSSSIDGEFFGSSVTDVELQKKYKEAEERVSIIFEELENEYFTRDNGLSMPALIQTIRNLIEDRKSLAMDVSSALLGRIQDRGSANKQLRLSKAEIDTRTRKVEREKNELQQVLEKELDRRSRECSMELERCHVEEQRLHTRVRELAEQNVSLQRDISTFIERETKYKASMECSNSQVTDLTTRLNEANMRTQQLQKNLCELKEKLLTTEEELHCFRSSYEEKDTECKDLHKSISKLATTCNEQGKTIDGLRTRITSEAEDDRAQMEQLRLVGVEQSLRRELESYRVEADSLRHENIHLLNRLGGKEGPHLGSIFNIDQVLQSRVCSLQNQGLSMLKEFVALSSKLLESLKGVSNGGVSKHFLIESDVKIQGYKRGVENLHQSLDTTSSLLQERSYLVNALSDSSGESNSRASKDILRELKAETLVTTALREKLYSNEMEIERIRAELAGAIRGNDILQCENQNALDAVSCLTHKLKDLELQMLKKEEAIRNLENEGRELRKELRVMKDILPTVSKHRDELWEEVKDLSEKNMVLNSEVGMLNKKVEAMDEDVLYKEGQITILKDALAKTKKFDFLSEPLDMTHGFLLD